MAAELRRMGSSTRRNETRFTIGRRFSIHHRFNTPAASLCRHVLPLAAPRRRRHCDLHVLARECLRYRLYGETWSTFIGGNRWNYMKNIHPLLRGYAMRVSDGSCRTPALDAGVCLRKFAIVRPQRL